MDTRLLKHFETELAYLQDMGAEFAASYPKIAARLGMESVEVLDPYIERLLEGTAFLTARVQLELEQQYPALTSHLLEIIYPHYLAPTPSMMVARFEPDFQNAALNDGYVLPRGSVLRNRLGDGDQTPCTFVTAADLTIWPIKISEAEYIEGRGALVAAGVASGSPAKAAIRLRLSHAAGMAISELGLERLPLFVGGRDQEGWALHEYLCTQSLGLRARSTDPRDDWVNSLPGSRLRPLGFERSEALLPLPRQSFDGYRLLQEYFAMPERFHFVELSGFGTALAQAKGTDVDIFILLEDTDAEISAMVTTEAFQSFCVPAINLFERRCDRVQVSGRDTEMHAIVDRTAPMDYEVHTITSVTGISGSGEEDTAFRPFFSAEDLSPSGDAHEAYYAVHRRMRQRTERERLKGGRTSYLGSETYLSLVDPHQAPYAADLRQLALRAYVTNRDLPMLLSSGGRDLFYLPDGGPVAHITTPVAPTRPKPTYARDETSWRLVSHLSLNYLSILDEGEGRAAAALRELLGLYAPAGDKVISKQLEGIKSVESRPIVRRMADNVLSTAVRGLEIKLSFDDSFYEGTGVYVLASVLERFFRKYVTINSFTETVLVTQERGELARWRPQTGLGRII